jgi:hypothetical protein
MKTIHGHFQTDPTKNGALFLARAPNDLVTFGEDIAELFNGLGLPGDVAAPMPEPKDHETAQAHAVAAVETVAAKA